ncbi:MAG: hypothetical protein PUC30_09385 [Lachnospiraceae bacterium]|nr:hypothetical protein [Lachnospiraceae bacterium]
MRIEQETRNIYAGGQQTVRPKTPAQISESLKKGRVFSGKLQFPGDKISERRREAQEKAMKVVKNAFAGELELDESVAELEQSVAKNSEEMVGYKKELDKVLEREAELAERTDLSKEEYEQELLEIKQAKEHFTGRISDGRMIEKHTLQAISDIKIERAKSSPMVDATENAEEILAEAGKEIVGMLMEEAKEHIDTENEKKQAAAEEKAEKEKELEERIEAMKAEKEEKEENSAPETEYLEAATKQMVKIAETGEIVQKELKNIVDQYKLDLADLKGAAVDKGV